MCRELRGNLVQIYWILLVPYVVFLICLEFFKMPESQGGARRIIKRAVISVILLYSFEECMNVISMISDGVTEKIAGVMQLKDLLKHMHDDYVHTEASWLKFREAVIYIMSLVSYIIAYLGVFVADVLTHFVWSILYVVSPLMILMYVSEKTSFVTASLYRGLINVVTWRIFWNILGVLLLKMATVPQVASTDNFLMAVVMNLCIGLCMLFIPFATKSLLTNGMESAATALAAAPSAVAAGAIKYQALKYGKKAVSGTAKASWWAAKEPFRGFRGTRELAAKGVNKVKNGVEKGKEAGDKAKKTWKRFRSHGVTDSRRTTSPFDERGPFSKKGRDRILNGKE